MKPVIEKYKEQLLSEGDVSAQDIVNIKAEVYRKLEASYEISKTYKSNSKEWESSAWPGTLYSNALIIQH